MIAAPPRSSTTPERPSVDWTSRLGRARSPWPYRRRLWIAAAIAFSLHVGLYISSRNPEFTAAEFAMGEPAPSLEMELVAGEEAVEPTVTPEPPTPEPVPEPPTPEPPQPDPVPEPEPEPMPEPEPVKEEMTVPTPEPPKPKPKPAPKPVTKPATPRIAAPAAPAGSPGAAVSGAPGGTGLGRGGKSSGPGYLSNPKPPYPPESRAAREHGLVLLHVSLDSTGRPKGVSVTRSCGFSRLDRAAQEAVRRWRFKPAMRDGEPVAASVDVPIRWRLP